MLYLRPLILEVYRFEPIRELREVNRVRLLQLVIATSGCEVDRSWRRSSISRFGYQFGNAVMLRPGRVDERFLVLTLFLRGGSRFYVGSCGRIAI